ncbi:ATP-binding protein [Nocardioides gansuensis]|nr:ATP-binding protein [Nocardioides gansuensis]
MKPPRSRHHGRSALAVSAWPLRRKLALALAIPLLLAATLGGLRVQSDLVEAANSSTSARQVTVLRPAVTFLTAAERAMVAAQTALDSSQTELDAAVADIKSAASELAEVRQSADLTGEQANQLDVVLDLSRALRDDNTDSLSPDTWIAQLRQLQSGVTQLITTIVNAQLQPEPRLELLAQTLAGRFSLAMQQALVATDRSGETGSLELFAELGVEGAAIDRLATALGDSQAEILSLREDNGERSRAIRTGGTDLGGAEAYADYDALIAELMDGIDSELAAAAADARQRALVNAAVTIGALVAALLLAFLVSRLLLTPIRRVREGALEVAHEQLPEAVARIRAGQDPGPITPIAVQTHEEVGQLARAVDDLHQQAVVLASGEAKLRSQVSEMFVTLSRRNTSLINQQLSLIETLEKDEEDPRRLESLFRLDHLAARMRRTADSLMILADAPTRSIGQTDVTVGESMQAATAGVKDYQRVRISSYPGVRLSDAAAADVIHLLTELVDNALSYSSPTSMVSVDATTGAAGITVQVSDAGLGIEDEALRALNETLRSGGEVTPDTARRMGLLVVSRLAHRHGISVQLLPNEQAGTTASVFLPLSVLPGLAPGEAAPLPPEPAVATTYPTEIVEPEGGGGRRRKAEEPQRSDASVQSRIDAAVGLPMRQPGAALENPPLPVRTPVAEAEHDEAAYDEATAEATEHLAEVAVLRVAEPPADAAPDPLNGPIDEEGASEEPGSIFTSMKSSWLGSDGGEESWRPSEIEAGWSRADSVQASEPVAVSPAGLPVREPGARLIPGGVSIPAVVATRNADAIRARLAAHAAGVSRGRESAGTSTDDEQMEGDPA